MNSTASLNFRILNFPIRVHISFFIATIFIGFIASSDTSPLMMVLKIAIWVLIVLFSILLHEMGHAITADYYGRAPRIELYSMGGMTIPTRNALLSYPKEILISFSGPLAGFLLGLLIYIVLRFIPPIDGGSLLHWVIAQLLWVNIGWGLINLIPILPLDGGQIMLNLYHWVRNPYDNRTPYIISIAFAIMGIIFSLIILGRGGIYLALLIGWLAYNNYMALRQGFWTDTFI
jgi:stage IV sporulation protein FB